MPRVVGTLPFRMPFTHRKGEGALVGDPQMCSLELSQRHLAPRAWNCSASSHLGWTGVLECKGHAKSVFTCLKSRLCLPRSTVLGTQQLCSRMCSVRGPAAQGEAKDAHACPHRAGGQRPVLPSCTETVSRGSPCGPAVELATWPGRGFDPKSR